MPISVRLISMLPCSRPVTSSLASVETKEAWDIILASTGNVVVRGQSVLIYWRVDLQKVSLCQLLSHVGKWCQLTIERHRLGLRHSCEPKKNP